MDEMNKKQTPETGDPVPASQVMTPLFPYDGPASALGNEGAKAAEAPSLTLPKPPQLSLNPVAAGLPVPEVPKVQPEEPQPEQAPPKPEEPRQEDIREEPKKAAQEEPRQSQENPFVQEAPRYSYQPPQAPPQAPQPPKPQRVRRVGTVTMGLSLIAAGILFSMSLLFHNVDVGYWLRFSPIVLVILGIEILMFNFSKKHDKLKYDFLSIFFSFVLIFVTLGVTFVTEGYDYYRKYILPQWSYSGTPQEIILEEGEALKFQKGSPHRGEERLTYVVKVAADGGETILFKGLASEEMAGQMDEAYQDFNENYHQLSEEYNNQLAEYQEEYENNLAELQSSYEEQLARQQEEYDRQLAEQEEEYLRQLEEQQENYNAQLAQQLEGFQEQISSLLEQ